MPEALTTLFDVGFFAALIRISTPLLLATLGELYNERAGVLNLGIEGIMLLGAMVGFTAAYFSGNLLVGHLHATTLISVLSVLKLLAATTPIVEASSQDV